MNLNKRYTVVLDKDGVEERMDVANSKAIAYGVFEVQSQQPGVFGAELIDNKTGKVLRKTGG
jgi:hypothetical protein